MDQVDFNVNDFVKVKLTELGVKILKTKHDEVKEMFPSLGDFKLNLDAEGYYKTQLHSLMLDFGKVMFPGATGLPFETNIILVRP